MGEGKLENASNYYAPSVWVETSGHSVEYLTVFRKIRDYCVSHAMLFTDLDAIENADMAITKNSKQIDVLIYTTHAKMKRITLSKDSRTAIVFLNEDVMRDFFDKLYSSFGEDVEILKMGIELQLHQDDRREQPRSALLVRAGVVVGEEGSCTSSLSGP